MNEELILTLAKQRLGITSNARDVYLQHVIKGVLDNLKNIRGIILDPERHDHIFFVAGYVVWQYQNKDQGQAVMPKWLRLELNNLMMKSGGDGL